jgi:two-component system chemotaxis response regulator CheB
MTMRVLIVDDSAFMRRAVTSMLTSDPEIQVVASARNGQEAVDLAKKLKPDVITLDIEMPEMDGLTALRHIMREAPTQVLMFSSLTTEGSHASLKALKLGAADVLAKDQSQVSLAVTNLKDDLLQRVKALGSSTRHRRPTGSAAPTSASDKPPQFRPGQFDVVVIGSSTGGPPVLETILGSIPANLATPIVIAQHMPQVFTRSMAERLNDLCPLNVVHANDGMMLERRCAYIAPGEQHTQIQKLSLARWQLKVGPEPSGHLFKPSVDVLFESAAQAVGKRTLAIVLTGIGEDGLQGARQLHALGAPILAQSQETCVVYGMPKAVTQAALVTACLSPNDLAQTLRSLLAVTAGAA